MHVKAVSALDPRSKTLKFIPKEDRQTVWNLMLNKVKKGDTVQSLTSFDECPMKRSRYQYSSSEDEDSENEVTSTSMHKELLNYKHGTTADNDVYPLVWWKDRSSAYTRLSRLERKYLCTTATTVPCERLFSKAGNNVCRKRASLHSDNVNKLCCLNSWLN